MSTGSKTTTTQSGPPKWAQPYFESFLQRAQDVTSQPYQAYGGPRVADFTPDQQQGMQQISNIASSPNRLATASNLYTLNAIKGQANPYLNNASTQKLIDQTSQDVTRNYRDVTMPNMLAQFNSGGAFGGSAMQTAMSGAQHELAGELGNIATQYRYNDANARRSAWETEQARRMQAAQSVPGLQADDFNRAEELMKSGNAQQALWQKLYDTNYGDFTEQRGWDASQLQQMAQALGTITGGSTTGANPNYRSGAENAAAYATILASMWGN